MSRIAIIGGGNIGEALLTGLLRAGRRAGDIVVSERVEARARYLADQHGVLVTGVADAVRSADFVIVAVKPSDVGPVTAEIAEAIARAPGGAPEQVVVSVAAGVTSAYYESKLPAGTPVIRVMPNAPMVVGAGVSAIASGRFADQEQLAGVAALFDSVGGVLTVPESQLDAVTALSGSGPGYFFLVVEALVDGGVAAGLSRSVATDLVVRTMAGSAAMLLDRMSWTAGSTPRVDAALAGDVDTTPDVNTTRDVDTTPDADTTPDVNTTRDVDTTPAQLRATITSPGGTTAAGLAELEKGGLRAALAAAIQAAKTRSEQLGITSE